MIIILEEETANLELTEQSVVVIETYDFDLPSGMSESVFTAAGQLLGSDGDASSAAVSPPSASGQILMSDLGQTTKMAWETVDLSQLLQTAVKTGSYTAVNNDHVLADVSGAGADFSIALPATPSTGNKVRVSLVAAHATWKVTINRNGSNVNGSTDTSAYSLVYAGDSFYFEYTGATLGWVAIGFVDATQAQMEAGTSQTVGVVPAVQQYHPSAAKGWIYFDTAGNMNAAYNVTSVTDNGVGDWSVNWATDFSSASYAAMAIAKRDSTGTTATAANAQIANTSFAAGVTRIHVNRISDGAFHDPNQAFCIVFGDQ